jgi:hypothetical protein
LKISIRWHTQSIADVTVSEGNATLEEKWLTESERKELATHFRETADELYPLEKTND